MLQASDQLQGSHRCLDASALKYRPPVLEVVHNGVIMGSEGFRSKGTYEVTGTRGSTLDKRRVRGRLAKAAMFAGPGMRQASRLSNLSTGKGARQLSTLRGG